MSETPADLTLTLLREIRDGQNRIEGRLAALEQQVLAVDQRVIAMERRQTEQASAMNGVLNIMSMIHGRVERIERHLGMVTV